MLRKAHDLTYRIEPGMLLYPGDEPPRVRTLSSNRLTATEVTIGCHVGTHVDAPAHFINGAATVEDLAMEHFFGLARVLPIGELGAADRGP